MPNGRLSRLVAAGFYRADRQALDELRAWWNEHRDEAERAAHRDAHLRMLLADFEATP